MQPIYQAFTASYNDMRPEAVAARVRHELRSKVRFAAWQAAMDRGADVLEADAAGQDAYWADAQPAEAWTPESARRRVGGTFGT